MYSQNYLTRLKVECLDLAFYPIIRSSNTSTTTSLNRNAEKGIQVSVGGKGTFLVSFGFIWASVDQRFTSALDKDSLILS